MQNYYFFFFFIYTFDRKLIGISSIICYSRSISNCFLILISYVFCSRWVSRETDTKIALIPTNDEPRNTSVYNGDGKQRAKKYSRFSSRPLYRFPCSPAPRYIALKLKYLLFEDSWKTRRPRPSTIFRPAFLTKMEPIVRADDRRPPGGRMASFW